MQGTLGVECVYSGLAGGISLFVGRWQGGDGRGEGEEEDGEGCLGKHFSAAGDSCKEGSWSF